ncbi:MAG TPA: nitroreductase family deazaflavin-dependent oxidoreductase [Candidatus Limnocylindrales bacterium]|jgi:deazaflavin-dependent oxidoreductase (nitroreductase family)|nr:nitroreductase family deazaflavin-dependent oxidoreductase [Candidatus Limnocylindrales bacterium]
MDEPTRRALSRGHMVEITTTGRRSGREHRIPVAFHNFDGRIYISGRPGRRDWYANLVADPRITLHLRGAVRADLPATARPITDDAERRAVLTRVAQAWRIPDPEPLIRRSPLIEVVFEEAAA